MQSKENHFNPTLRATDRGGRGPLVRSWGQTAMEEKEKNEKQYSSTSRHSADTPESNRRKMTTEAEESSAAETVEAPPGFGGEFFSKSDPNKESEIEGDKKGNKSISLEDLVTEITDISESRGVKDKKERIIDKEETLLGGNNYEVYTPRTPHARVLATEMTIGLGLGNKEAEDKGIHTSSGGQNSGLPKPKPKWRRSKNGGRRDQKGGKHVQASVRGKRKADSACDMEIDNMNIMKKMKDNGQSDEEKTTNPTIPETTAEASDDSQPRRSQ